MKGLKKELPIVILIFLIGISFILLAVWNAEQFDKTHPKTNSYYEYEIAHK